MNCIPSSRSKSSGMSLLERQWSSGCNPQQPSRYHAIICAKECSVPGGIETLIKHAPSTSSSHDSSYSHATGAIVPSQIAPYSNETQITNPVSGSFGGKARHFAGKVMKAAKGTADKMERQMAEMALRMADQSKTQELATAVCLVSQPILASYPGSARYEEWDKTEELALTEEHENEIIWSIPILLPEAIPAEADKDRMIQIRIQLKSSASLRSKQYVLGYATFRLSELLNSKNQRHFTASLRSDVLGPNAGASVEVYIVDNKKYPRLGGMGWSLTDPMPDLCGAVEAPFCPPLEQIYALRGLHPQSGSPAAPSFPQGVVMAVERTQESTVVLPVSICVTRLLAEAAMVSANHADSVARRIKANALRFSDPFEACENQHAECVLEFCHLMRFDVQVPVGNPQYQQPRPCNVRVSLQPPDCVFELPVGGSHIPAHFGSGQGTNIPYVTAATLPFYPKLHQSTPSFGVLRFEVRVESSLHSSQVQLNPPASRSGLWEGYADIDTVKNNPNGAFLEIPMFVTQPVSRMVATLVIKLTVRNPPPSQANPTVLSPDLGLIALLGMKSLSDSSLDNAAAVSESGQSSTKLGDFLSLEWIDEHAKKRHLDAGTLVSRYESYKLALQKLDPQLSLPPCHRKCPSSFRPSSSKRETVLSGIPFNTHVQALVLEPLLEGGGTQQTWHNITCGAAADHPRGFTATGNKPGGAGGVRRLESKREEMAKLSSDSQKQLWDGVQAYIKENKMRKHIPLEDQYMGYLRSACYRAEQKLADLTWEVALRRGNVFSQVLGTALTAYLAAVSDPSRATTSAANTWLNNGFLLCFEGLLSAAGKETAMIEDAAGAIDMLKMVKVELVEFGTYPMGNKSVSVGGSKVIRCIELVREQPSVAPSPSTGLEDIFGALIVSQPAESATNGEGGLILRVALDAAYFANRVPGPLRNGAQVQFYAMLFQMGVDIMQWGANATNKIGTAIQNPADGPGCNPKGVTDSISVRGEPFEDDEDDEDADAPDNDILVALNHEAFRKLNKYAFIVRPVDVGAGAATFSNGTGVDPVHPILDKLWRNICDSANKMEHGVLDTAGAAAEQMGGSGVIFCKSGKDRTAMQATLKQSQFLARAGVRKFENSSILSDATLMRIHGTRLPICEKNVGQPKYAFNALQAKFMPEMLKPPLGSVAGFLKGGKLFSREGSIES